MPKQKSGLFDPKVYGKQYQQSFIVYRKINFNRQNSADMEMMNWIDEQEEGTSNYLKRLVRSDMDARAEQDEPAAR